ncbi:hypothetical protein D3877_23460 [Azospirillum cavernae]|uniref:Uncharacterized protein n=1 Tax=Azospirillum cavernae TaxID=2320860 RepID=A0A418VPD0_9PROT|nr:hypothetical protein [Azospirillum cavernae]RJF78091.1 hypothetical protein D3877_23460 [Azospirillum cavernae]
MRFYPDLSQKTLAPLQVVQEQLRLDPAYLDADDCSYDAKVKELLKLLAPGSGDSPQAFLRRAGSKQQILEDETQALYLEIRDFGQKLKADDVSERMSYYRTRTALLEKLISLTERASSMKAVGQFQDIVLGIFEDMLTPDQRAEAMERLGAALETQDDHG